MSNAYHKALFTSDVLAAQDRYYGKRALLDSRADRDALGDEEIEFIRQRDSFYLATVTADGWPYVQHRGGPAGFLQVIDRQTLAFADFRGNRQLVSVGNLSGNDRASLLLMDYPHRLRLKIIGHAAVLDAREHPALLEQIAPPGLERKTERITKIDVVGFDWNCAAHITPRYTEREIAQAMTRTPG